MSFALTRQSAVNQKAANSITAATARPSISSHSINNLAMASLDSINNPLQRTIGSQAVQRLMHSDAEEFDFAKIGVIQPKLKLSHPEDAYEKEADKVAEDILKINNSSSNSVATVGHTRDDGIDRKCTTCKSTNEDNEQFNISERPSATSNLEVSPEGTKGINGILSSDGSPLDINTKDFMEARFGYNFSNVRIHTDKRAAASASAIDALAYTVGNHIIFGEGTYSSDTHEGRKLLAHELAHVVQQSAFRRSPSIIQRQPVVQGRLVTADFIYANNRNIITELNDQNFEIMFFYPNSLLVVDFWAPWCRPCDTMAAHTVRLANAYRSGPFRNVVRFFQVRMDPQVNPRIWREYGIASFPGAYIYLSTGRGTTRFPRPVGTINGLVSIAQFDGIIQEKIREYAHVLGQPGTGAAARPPSVPAARPPSVHHQDVSTTTSAAPNSSSRLPTRRSGLLINLPIVRMWMWEAYRRSRMGGLRSMSHMNPPEEEVHPSREFLRRHAALRHAHQREVFGWILEHPDGTIHCLLNEQTGDAGGLSVSPIPPGLREGNMIGESRIIASFHTHPAPPGHPGVTPGPSRGDRQMTSNPDYYLTHGREHYIIGVYTIWIFDGSWRIVGNTEDILFGGIRGPRPGPESQVPERESLF